MAIGFPRWHLPLLLAVLTLGLAGCGACPRDPNKAGLICGGFNSMSGVYADDTRLMAAQADDAEARVRGLSADNERIQAELSRLNAQQQALRRRQIRLNNQLASQVQRLDQARRAGLGRSTETAALQRNADAIEAQQRDLNARNASQVDPAEIRRLEERNDSLQRQLDGLFSAPPAD